MKKDPGLIIRVCLMLGDVIAIFLSFVAAYFIRTNIDSRPFYFEARIGSFALSIFLLIPIWLIVLAALGLYQKSIFLGQGSREFARLTLASVIGTMAIITFDFFSGSDLFPVRVVAVVSALLCLILLVIFRTTIKFIYRRILKNSKYSLRAVVIGNSQNTEFLVNYLSTTPESGFRLAGIVANNHYIPPDLHHKKYSSLKEAIKKAHPDVIFQTDEKRTEYSYRKSLERHLLYYFVPSETALSSHFGELELIGNTPAILVRPTPLMGFPRFFKRTIDIVVGLLALIIAAIPMGIIWLALKITSPSDPAIYASYRLSRYNRKVKIYKFRSLIPKYNGLSPEDAFEKMGRPELIEKYRKNGDQLKNDPRIGRLGAFLRRTSLDELPQLVNVLKGDISLVGPRALVPGELKNYGDRSLILSVKSGLTGLAQVSGRRDISFEERRALDIYYVQNWSLLMDFQIMLRTISAVFKREGAR